MASPLYLIQCSLLLLLCSQHTSEGKKKVHFDVDNSIRQKEKEILDKILGSRDDNGFMYDARIRPQAIDKDTNVTDAFGPTVVTINIYLRTINDINDYKMEFAVQITFRQKWIDPRLRFNDQNGKMKYLTMTDPKKVWMPDTFFRNEKIGHFHNILVNNVYIRIFPNGEVLYSIRISLTLSCPMNLKLYPMDRQTCSLKIASYGYTTDDIVYMWENLDPVQIAKGLNLPRFNIEKYSSSYCNVKTNTGEYSCLSVDLVFKRQFSYYLITIYIPGCMLVIVSWVNFWLDPKAVPARVSLGVTTLLTMSTQTASISSTLPPVAYTKAIDVWQGVCVGFVFSALMEYALVNYALRDNVKRRRRSYFNPDLRQAMLPMSNDDCKYYDQSDYNQDMDGVGDDDDGNGDCMRMEDDLMHQQTTTDFILSNGAASFVLGPSGAKSDEHLLEGKPSIRSAKKSAKNRKLNGGLSLSKDTSPQSTGAGTVWPDTGKTVDGQTAFHRQEMGLTGNILLNPLLQDPAYIRHLERREAEYYRTRFLISERAKKIDVTSRFLFPLVFAIFNIAYWTTYLREI